MSIKTAILQNMPLIFYVRRWVRCNLCPGRRHRWRNGWICACRYCARIL